MFYMMTMKASVSIQKLDVFSSCFTWTIMILSLNCLKDTPAAVDAVSTPTSTAGFESTQSPIGQEFCWKGTQKFVSDLDLCGKRLQDLPSSRSCKDRCGLRPSQLESSEKCSCDQVCWIYEDCCLDFQSVCPREFEELKANVIFKSIANLYVSCTIGLYKGIGDLVKDNKGAGFSTTMVFTPPLTSSENPPSTFDTTLVSTRSSGWLMFLDHFPGVYDRSTGLLFESHSLYKKYETEHSEQVNVPYIFQVPGEYTDDTSRDKYVFAFLWNSSLRFIAGQNLDSELRGCFVDELIQCKACEGRRHYLSHICPQRNERQLAHLPQSYISWLRDVNIIVEDSNCQSIASSKGKTLSQEMLANKKAVMVQKVPYDEENQLVRFAGTPWRELLCPNREDISSLDQCELKTCAFGNLLVEDTSECFRPDYIDVRIVKAPSNSVTTELPPSHSSPAPFCTCYQVFLVLQRMSALKLTKFKVNSSTCAFPVHHAETPTIQELMDVVLNDENHEHLTVSRFFEDLSAELNTSFSLGTCLDIYKGLVICLNGPLKARPRTSGVDKHCQSFYTLGTDLGIEETLNFGRSLASKKYQSLYWFKVATVLGLVLFRQF